MMATMVLQRVLMSAEDRPAAPPSLDAVAPLFLAAAARRSLDRARLVYESQMVRAKNWFWTIETKHHLLREVGARCPGYERSGWFDSTCLMCGGCKAGRWHEQSS